MDSPHFFHNCSYFISLLHFDSGHPPSINQSSLAPLPLTSFWSSLVVLGFLCQSLLEQLSKHCCHPSSACPSVLWSSTIFQLHMAITIALSVLLKIVISFFFFNIMSHFHRALLILPNNDKLYLSFSKKTYFQVTILHIP